MDEWGLVTEGLTSLAASMCAGLKPDLLLSLGLDDDHLTPLRNHPNPPGYRNGSVLVVPGDHHGPDSTSVCQCML